MAVPEELRRRPARPIVARNSSFGLLWSGQLLSSVGTWLLVVAVPVYVFHLTGSASATGLALVAEVAPMVVLGPVAGVLADRRNRRVTMVGTDLGRAASVLLLIFVTSPGRVWLLLAAIVAENGLGVFFTPAYQAVVPFTVGRGKDLEMANAWSTAASGVTRLAGGPLGGVVYAALGFRSAVTLDAASYVIAAACIAAMPALRGTRVDPVGRTAGSRPRAGLAAFARGFAADLRAGLMRLARHRTLAVLLAATTAFLAGNGAVTALVVPFITTRLGGNARTVGILFCALGGGYLASAYAGRRACASGRLRACVTATLAGVVVTFAVLFNTRSLAVAIIAIGLAGLAGGAFLMMQQTLLQRHAEDAVIGRIGALFATATSAATLAGALLASLAVRALGLTVTLNLSVAVIAASPALALLLPRSQPATGPGDPGPGDQPGGRP